MAVYEKTQKRLENKTEKLGVPKAMITKFYLRCASKQEQ